MILKQVLVDVINSSEEITVREEDVLTIVAITVLVLEVYAFALEDGLKEIAL